jgi:hypothetical protein
MSTFGESADVPLLGLLGLADLIDLSGIFPLGQITADLAGIG